MMRLLVVCLLLLSLAAAGTGIEHVSRTEAVQAIENATQDIEEMRQEGFPTAQQHDTLQQARQALQRADYVRILEQNATGPTARKARAVLAGLNRSQFTYANVMTYTRQIQERRERAFRLADELAATRFAIRDARANGVNTTAATQQLNSANASFHQGRFDATETQVEEANAALNAAQAERSVVNVVQAGAASLLQRYGPFILLGLAVLLILGRLGLRWWRRRRLQWRLSQLRTEKDVLHDLMQETQERYFAGTEMPERVYRIRMDAYRERLNTVEEEIVVTADTLG